MSYHRDFTHSPLAFSSTKQKNIFCCISSFVPFLLHQTAVDWHLNGNFFSSHFSIGRVLIRFGFNTAQVYHWIKPGMIKRKRWVEGGSWLFFGDGREGARLRRMESDLPFSSVNVDLCGRRRAVGRMSERPVHLSSPPPHFFFFYSQSRERGNQVTRTKRHKSVLVSDKSNSDTNTIQPVDCQSNRTFPRQLYKKKKTENLQLLYCILPLFNSISLISCVF